MNVRKPKNNVQLSEETYRLRLVVRELAKAIERISKKEKLAVLDVINNILKT